MADGNRFVVFEWKHIDSEERYGIEDLAWLPAEPLMNWAKGKKATRPWRGTKPAADHLASLLNRNHHEVDFVHKGTELNLSQLIAYANDARRKRRRGARSSPATLTPGRTPMPRFKTCTCGAMYKGDSHCGG